MTNPPASSRPANNFALGVAQQHIATMAFQFELRSRESTKTKLHIDITPLGQGDRHGTPVTSFRRMVKVMKMGQEISRNSSVNHVDLNTRCLVGLDVEGLVTDITHASPLPAIAAVGESGPYFENTVTVKANAQSTHHRSIMTWSLEPWTDGLALWCIGVQPPGAQGLESAECYAITQTGDVVGAVLRMWTDMPSADQPAPSTTAPALRTKRMIEFVSR